MVIADLSAPDAETECLSKTTGGTVLFRQTDISREADVARLVQEGTRAFGPVNLLINTADLEPVASVLEMEVAQWDRVMAANLRGTFLACKAVLPGMLARGHGTIINMISIETMPYLAAFSASKQGIAGLSQSLAGEVGERGIRVIALAPGFVDTPGLREVGAQLAPHLGMTPDQFLHRSPHPAYAGMMPAEHAAAAVAYLVVKLAPDYHGALVTGYTVLERAGILAASSSAPTSPIDRAANERKPGATGDEALRQGVAASLHLQEIIAQTEEEFGMLPNLVRPVARGWLEAKTGQSIQEWAQTAHRLAEYLKGMQAEDSTAEGAFRISCAHLRDQLDKLLAYYQGAPGEMARCIKDTEVLREFTQTIAERVRLIRSLMGLMEVLQQWERGQSMRMPSHEEPSGERRA